MPQDNSDPHKKIIDFDKLRRREQKRTRARRRKGWLAAAAAAAVLLAVGLLVTLQVREAVDDRGFWQNFNTTASVSH